VPVDDVGSENVVRMAGVRIKENVERLRLPLAA
jgi:hypothetical protein